MGTCELPTPDCGRPLPGEQKGRAAEEKLTWGHFSGPVEELERDLSGKSNRCISLDHVRAEEY